MRRRWPRRLLVTAFVLLLLAVVGATWFTHRLMVEVLSGRAFAAPEAAEITDPLTLGYRGDPSRALGLPFTELTVDTPLGPAPAWLVPGAEQAQLGAIFVHGIGGAREDGYAYLRELHAAGLPTLLITYRNDAGAPAAPDGLRSFGLTEWQDLEAAMIALQAQGVQKVVLVGASMGGGIIGQFLARSDLAADVAAVVLDAPALDFPMVLAHVTDRLGLPLRSLGTRLALPAFALTHGANLGQAQVIPVLAAFPGPVLLFHGSADRIVPKETSFALLAARQGQTTFLHTRGDHLQSRAAEPARFSALLAGFLAALPR
ncbi:alpha/beta fold hydrolase [Gemmobacter fulvus]|uniref:alpha/beta hydrolase family protein n=1 Tax=Gemmobacter fulvus TaxID=2840474 RepID=UPI0027967AD7|nr:alpha/beta fold hydrolase [Gemmobacter fulvus]MDQ1847338.1 alpha/beta fold hydrolase [Gemmobacter fulvus]